MSDVLGRRAASIAVAPVRRGPEPEQQRIASAFVEDVIGELARFPTFEVLAARTSLSLSEAELEPRRLAETFGVTHLLDSSIRTGREALQVKAGLVETGSGRLVWNHAYNVPLRQLEEVQAEIAVQVANQMSSQIDMKRLVQARARPIANLKAYDCWLRGRDCLRKGTRETDAEARLFFERALTLDPTYARAYAGLSLSHFNEWSCIHWGKWADSERLAFDYACKAEELDETDHIVQSVLGRIQMYRRNYGQARRHMERAVALCPNDADSLIQISMWHGFLGEPQASVAMVEKALRLNPLRDPWYYVYAFLPYFFARDLERAVELGEKGPPNMIVDQSAYMAACYAHMGEAEKARRELAQFLEVFQDKITFGRPPEPGEALDYLLHVNPFVRQEDADFLVEGLRLAGYAGERRSETYLPPRAGEPARFVLEGGLWEADYAGRSVRLKDMKGCRDIALLLASPGERIHCLEIAGRIAEGDGGVRMDARARAECQRRIVDLQAALEEAERDNDFARTERLSAELDRLIEELSAALGLGGRARKLGDPVEKARTAVTWRVRNAIKKIAEAHPELGRHLAASVRTGAFCGYDPEQPVVWTV